MKLNEKGIIAQALMLLLLAAGIGAGIFLIKNPQIFKSGAGGGSAISFKSAKGEKLPLNINNIPQTTSSTFQIELTSPFGPPVFATPEAFFCSIQSVEGAQAVRNSHGELVYYVIDSGAKAKITAQVSPSNTKVKWEIGSVSKNLPDGGRFEYPDQNITNVVNFIAPNNPVNSLESTYVRAILSASPKASVTCPEIIFAVKPKLGNSGSSGIGATARVLGASTQISGTVSYKIAESPTELAKALEVPFNSDHLTFNYILKDATPGIKTIWVEFKDVGGQTSRQSAQIENVSTAPSPTVAVVELENPINAPVIIAREVANEFYKNHEDKYDFLAISFDYNRRDYAHVTVKNNVQGIGSQNWKLDGCDGTCGISKLDPNPIFDKTAEYGSKGNLLGIGILGPIADYIGRNDDPSWIEEIIGHQFGVYLGSPHILSDPLHVNSDESFGHWNNCMHFPRADLTQPYWHGNMWTNNGDGTWTRVDQDLNDLSKPEKFDPFMLYFMGFLPPEKVPNVILLEPEGGFKSGLCFPGKTIKATPRVISIQDIIQRYGPRIPSYKDSQKEFSTAFILVKEKGKQPTPGAVEKLTEWAIDFPEAIRKATSYSNISISSPTPIPTPNPSDKNITSCSEITTSGDYLLTKDITTNDICLNIHDTNNINLDCQNHTINSKFGAHIKVLNTSKFSIKNCNLVINLSVSNPEGGDGIVIQNSSIGNVENNTSSKAGIRILTSKQLQVLNNTVNSHSPFSQHNSSFNTINGNKFTADAIVAGAQIPNPGGGFIGSGGADGVLVSDRGSNNTFENNIINGSSDGISHSEGNIGADDGILLAGGEKSTNIIGNTIKNVWDCGIENIGPIQDIQITKNNISNSGVCGIGGWYWNSWLRNSVDSNVIDGTPTMFYLYRANGLLNEGSLHEENIFFQDNIFSNNSFLNQKTIAGKTDISSASINFQNIPGEIPSSNVKLGNNVFKNNDFNKSIAAPLLLPASAIKDGGGNICGTVTDSNYPLACGKPNSSSTPQPSVTPTPTPNVPAPVSGGGGGGGGGGGYNPPVVTPSGPKYIKYIRYSEDPIDLKNANWKLYTPGEVLGYEFKDSTAGPKFVFVQFSDDKYQVIKINNQDYISSSIELIKEQAPAPTGTAAPVQIPNTNQTNTPSPLSSDGSNCPIENPSNYDIGTLYTICSVNQLARFDLKYLVDFPNNILIDIGRRKGNLGEFLANFSGERLLGLPPYSGAGFSLDILKELPDARKQQLPGYIQDQLK